MVRKASWGLMTLLAASVALYAFAGVTLPGHRPPLIAQLFEARALRAFGHLGAGGFAILTGALQFSVRIRVMRPRLHRMLGRVYVVAVVIGGVAGGLLAPSSMGGVTAHLGFGMLALLWVTSALVAWRRARSGDYLAHRAWMIRSYALCLAAVTLRLYLPLSAAFGVPFESAYPAIAWLCWVPNLVVTEWLVVPGSWVPLEPTGPA